ncbi:MULTISPECIES: HlyD family secretion protein [unclassified Sedimentibacter]|uniref:HlyD family secretion protein n=1 Tax=unclassified Sedimentibacter TaxID=2649220 RepID=UPI0027DF01CD|nr:HlyD family efflux transporter periplasmic adaptor subunit [Sedimentibacter sp. MB35-C1]WMJ76919.1 HlyD family efflux transporter periplasmic adaptor subunit [Sedimentibacter sp. MB35-C1]
MIKILNHIKGKGKLIIMPAVIILVLISIYIFNGLQKNDSAIVYADGGTYIESSGVVKNGSISLSSEITGTVIENKVKEGDNIKKGAVIAVIDNTALKNQYDQALTNFQITEKNIEALENSISSLSLQNTDVIQQAHNAYLVSEAEYQKVMDGASADEIKQAEEVVNQAKTNFDFMKTNLERSTELFEQQIISQSKYDEALKSYNVSEAQYNAAVSQLNLIKSGPTKNTINAAENKMLQAKAGYELAISNGNTQLSQLQGQLEIAKVQLEQSKNIVEQTKRELDKLTIKSPIDGIVNSLLIKNGEFVSMGKLIAEIYNPENVEIKAYVSEANIGHIIVGQDANIFIDSHNEKAYHGKVTRINNTAEFTPKNIQTKEERVNTVFEVTVEALDSKGAIKPGMPVDVNIKID